MHNADGKDYKVNSLLKDCFARPSIDTIGWCLQMIFKLTSIVSIEDLAQHCFKNECTLAVFFFWYFSVQRSRRQWNS